MDSALDHFLKNDYLYHFGNEWDESVMHLRKEERASGKIEIRDGRPTIIQYPGKGVSIINNNSRINVEIIDFEHFCNSYRDGNERDGRRCDFIINPIAGYDFIVFNELTESESKYVEPYICPEKGKRKDGKRLYVLKQLTASIETFYEVNDFLDEYKKRIALFSCRLTDGNTNRSSVIKSMKAFRKPQHIISNIRSNEPMPHGFVFEQRIYDEAYKVT